MRRVTIVADHHAMWSQLYIEHSPDDRTYLCDVAPLRIAEVYRQTGEWRHGNHLVGGLVADQMGESVRSFALELEEGARIVDVPRTPLRHAHEAPDEREPPEVEPRAWRIPGCDVPSRGGLSARSYP